MKKLLNGIFRSSSSSSSAGSAATTPNTSSSYPNSASSSSNAKRTYSPPPPIAAAATPPSAFAAADPYASTAPTSSAHRSTGPRSSWESFFATVSTPPPARTPLQPVHVIPTSEKVFHQNLDILVREAVAKIKTVIAKMIAQEDFARDLAQLSGFVTLAADKLQQHSDPAAVVLRSYFASPAGAQLCEQTAFPSLVLDFLDNLRAFLLREELERMVTTSQMAVPPPQHEQPVESSNDDIPRSIAFLMGCVHAIATIPHLIETYRCEIPNLIHLAAEQFPQRALCLRDFATHALAAIADTNFNAGVVWYLHDCSVVTKTVDRIRSYAAAPIVTTPAAAAAVLQTLDQTRAAVAIVSAANDDPAAVDALAATAAAVSDALGLNKQNRTTAAVGAVGPVTTVPAVNADVDRPHDTPAAGTANAPTTALQATTSSGSTSDVSSTISYSLASFDPLVGLKTLVFVLQKTCRHALVLLGEFQAAGGYALLTQLLLQATSEQHQSTLIYVLTLLLPLGTGFANACITNTSSDDSSSIATVITSGARNVGAFCALRDLLLSRIHALEGIHVSDGEYADALRMRDEQLVLQLLTTILHVYTSDYCNVVRLEPPTQTLALLLTKLPWIPFVDAKVIVLRIVEYVCAAAAEAATFETTTTTTAVQLPIELLAIVCSLFIESSVTETAQLLDVTSDSSNDDDNDDGDEREATDANEPAYNALALLLGRCLVKVLQHATPHATYRNELDSFGLLERGVYAFFVKTANALAALRAASADGDAIDSDARATTASKQRALLLRLRVHLDLWSTIAALMLRNHWSLGIAFRELQVHQSLYAIADALVTLDLLEDVSNSSSNAQTLSVFAILIELAYFTSTIPSSSSRSSAMPQPLESTQPDDDNNAARTTHDERSLLQSGVESDVSHVLALLQKHRGSPTQQCILLRVLKLVLQGRAFVWGPWQACHGHAILIAILSSITLQRRGDDNDISNNDQALAVIDAILNILGDVLDPLHGDAMTRQQFASDVGYAALATCLVTSGVLETPGLASVLNRVFELVTGTSPPRNKIRNAEAVETLFCLLPCLQRDTAAATLARLLVKLTSNDEHAFSRKKQVALLVHAGAFRWLAAPAIVQLIVQNNDNDDDGDASTSLRAPLMTLILVLSRDELATRDLRAFMRVVARAMPQLLGNTFDPRRRHVALSAVATTTDSDAAEAVDGALSDEIEEVGLYLLEQALKGSRVPQVVVGTQVKTRMASGYVHIVNSMDRLWPPSSGYSFACWVRFPADVTAAPAAAKTMHESPSSSAQQRASDLGTSDSLLPTSSSAAATAGVSGSDGATVSVALCEGPITITLDGDDTASGECYCVLVGPTLTFFTDSDAALRNDRAVQTLDVTAVASSSELAFYFWSHEKRFAATCRAIDDVAMWLRAMQQSESISNVSIRQRHALADGTSSASTTSDDELLFVSSTPAAARGSASSLEHEHALDGFVCLLSVYSIESPGCYVRMYFEQTTGCLRVDTGSVSAGPNMNATAKRTTATFRNIDLALLRASHSTATRSSLSAADKHSGSGSTIDDEESSHWHHLTFTHRKTVVGSSLLTLYIDGSEVTTKKLSYPSAPTTGSMQAFVGKDIQVCGTFPALPWSIGPAWLTEEVLSANGVVCMFLLGPSFSGQFSGHAYRSAGDWPEAHASAQLDRATLRRVDIARIAKRLQLTKLGRASRRHWSDTSSSSSGGVNALVTAASDLSSIAESAVATSAAVRAATSARREDASDGFRFPTSAAAASGSVRKEQQRIEAFQRFIQDDCAMSTFGNEILQLLSSFKIADDLVLFSLNTAMTTTSSNNNARTPAHTTAPTVSHTQFQYVGTERSVPLDLPKVLPSVGGVTQMLLPLLENAWRAAELSIVLDLLSHAVRQNPSCMAECLDLSAYALVASVLTDRIQLVNERVLQSAVRLAVSTGPLRTRRRAASADAMPPPTPASSSVESSERLSLVVDAAALSQIVLSNELRRLLPWRLQCHLVHALLDVLDPVNPNALFNARQLRRAGLLAWLLLYVSEICNEDCTLDKAMALEHRWCFPSFAFAGYNELLQRLLALLRAYLRVENHVDDVFAIADMLLLSLTTESVHRRESPLRVVLLQFLLHEVESDAGVRRGGGASTSSASAAAASSALDANDLIAPTIVDAVLYRAFVLNAPVKKRKDKDKAADAVAAAASSSGAGILSPTASAASSTSTTTSQLAPDGVETILLELIRRTDAGPFASLEALLALRLLLSLAQEFAVCAQYLFQSSLVLQQKLKRSLQSYSTDANTYVPLLAYVSSVPIKDVAYAESISSPSAVQLQYQQSLSASSSAFAASPDRFCVDQVWEVLGCLLLRNCEVPSEPARAIAVAVLSQLALRTEVSESFFAIVCATSATVFRVLVQCILSQSPAVAGVASTATMTQSTTADAFDARDNAGADATGERTGATTAVPRSLQYLLGCLLSNRPPESVACELTVACLELLKLILSRSLFERDEFAAFMMYVLECLDDGVSRQQQQRLSASITGVGYTLADAQKCWLALVVHIVKSTQALTDNCSLVVLRNLCTLGVALARYLVDESKHQQHTTSTASPSPPAQRTESRSNSSSDAPSSCFGTDVLMFLLSSIRMCAEPHIAHTVGTDEQQFVYGCLVYCAQTVLLNELSGCHRTAPPPQRLLDCLVASKHLLLQQTKCSSVIVCGSFVSHHPASDVGTSGSSSGSSNVASPASNAVSNTNTAPPNQTGFSGRLNRMRSLSANAHKEFGIGSESDRSFLLSLAAELFRMLLDDAERVRLAAIVTWQFVLQQRTSVLKELLIVEPRVSLLQNITTTKREAIDVFHGGFDRLLHVRLPQQRLESRGASLYRDQSSSDNVYAVERIKDGNVDAASTDESWLQFHIWLTDNLDLLKDLILVRTEPIVQHLLDVLLSCICVRKVTTTSAAMRLLAPIDVALNVDFAVYYDPELGGRSISVSAAPSSELASDASAFKTAARKTLFKLSNVRESSVDAMVDAQTRWRETLLQLLQTRSVWQTEGWRAGTMYDQRLQASASAPATGSATTGTAASSASDAHGIEHHAQPFYVERSIFQQNAFKYRLDCTEGPQRMRLRLVRSYESWRDDSADASTPTIDAGAGSEMGQQQTSAQTCIAPASAAVAGVDASTAAASSLLAGNESHPLESSSSSNTVDLLKHSRELHEAVEVFRELHFQLLTSSFHMAADETGDGEDADNSWATLLTAIVSRTATLERTREAFAVDAITWSSSTAARDVAAVARRVFQLYIVPLAASMSNSSSSTSPSSPISDATISDMERVLDAAEANLGGDNVIPSTVFDIADSELLQATIPTTAVAVVVDNAAPLVPVEAAVRACSSPLMAAQTTIDSDQADSGNNEGDDGGMAPSAMGKINRTDGAASADDNNDSDDDGDDTLLDQPLDRTTTTPRNSTSTEMPRNRNRQHSLDAGAMSEDPGSGGERDGLELLPSRAGSGSPTTDAVDPIDSSNSATIFDRSYDYTYGGIARFLQRDDYAPLRCYNAIYIAGMDKIDGIFVLCRHALYFIGGYEKLFYHHHTSDVDAAATASGATKSSAASPASPTVMSMNSPFSPTGSSNSNNNSATAQVTTTAKKKTKNLLRNTLADLSSQFSHAKTATSQLFTVVPLVTLSDTTSASSFQQQQAPEQRSAAAAAAIATKRWSIRYAHVKQFSRIKYQLRPVGIEFFSTFGATFFLQFESETERDEIIKLLFQMPLVNSVFWSPLLRSSALSLSVKRMRQALTKRWLRGAISNFEYLMHLNTLAGRSFNDITQYPVFPWIVADYTSDFLDLDAPATFRDLSKPMGALGANRAAQFRERFAAMSDVGPGSSLDTPAFHYGTHYSCSAYVVNYLIRLEPFTQLALELQGGSFDHADRLFCNIPSSWKSASTDNLQDVRELIPEFFYLPEFLYNANAYDFGTTQSGDVVSHVRLPPWACGDAREFVRLHRQALESKFVSENLHQWIDLIFGVKQTGTAAFEAQNVFMHVTYEGVVDIDAIDDVVMRNATLSQIENFGQTPSRLFSSPHPQRKVPTLLSLSSSSSSASTASTSTTTTAFTNPSGVGHQYDGNNTLSSIEAYVKWHTPLAPALVPIGKDYVFLKKVFAQRVSDDAIGDVRFAGSSSSSSSSDKVQCRGLACTFVPPRFTKYADWGCAVDGTIKFRVHQSSARYREANKVIGVIEGAHYCRVTCATFSDDGHMFVTGGQDGVVNALECLKVHGQRVFKQFAKLVGHDDVVLSVAINKEFNLIASGSADCCTILWDLRTRAFLRELVGHSAPVTHVAINSANANVLTATTTELRVWSINGDLLAATNAMTCGLSAITCAIATRCDAWQRGVIAVTGHSNGTIALWGLSYPSDIERERRARCEAAEFQQQQQQTSGALLPQLPAVSLPSAANSRAGGPRPAVRIGDVVEPTSLLERDRDCGESSSSAATRRVLKVVPSCQLFIMKLLLDHRAGVTALTLGSDQRQLLSGDADGHCIRWVDDSISTNIM